MIESGQIDEDFFDSLIREFPREISYLVAVSGGRDSMALLHILLNSGYRDLTVCHINHGLRAGEAAADSEFVRTIAKNCGLPFHSMEVDVKAHSAETSQSIETAARELRYRCFAEIASSLDCPRVMLGHHADDQVETILMNFFRGSGTRGISGMCPVRERSVNGTKLTLIRPMLSVSREEIDRYLSENGIKFRDDESNHEMFALRNRIRHQLIPKINEVFGRDTRPAIFRSSELAQRMGDWIDSENISPPVRDEGLDVAALREMPGARRDWILYQWLRSSGIPDCGFAEVERVVEVLQSNDKPAKANLPGDHHVRRRSGVLFLEFPETGNDNTE